MKCEEYIAGFCRKAIIYKKYAAIRQCNKCCLDCKNKCENVCSSLKEGDKDSRFNGANK